MPVAVGEGARILEMGLNHAPPSSTRTSSHDLTSDEVTSHAVALRSKPKRILDASLAVVGLFLSCPIWVVASIAIKLDDRGRILYSQRRFGRGGRSFSLLKFRTMRAHPDLHGLRPAAQRDLRITRVGRVLRATGIDELPQLWAILKGDMSLVGPRALAVGELIARADGTVTKFEEIPGFHERLAVKPGLTGLATVYLAKDADPLKKLEYDLRYIDEYSFWLDVRLILLSLWISFQGRWETRDPKL